MSTAPGGGVLLASAGMETGHYVGSHVRYTLWNRWTGAIQEGKQVDHCSFSGFSILLGVLFLAIMVNWPLHTVLTPHPVAMASIAELDNARRHHRHHRISNTENGKVNI